MSVYVAVDIGGTHIRVATYPKEGITPLKVERVRTRSPQATPEERLMELIAAMWPEDGIVYGIGVAAPGPTNPEVGIIYSAPNVPGWKDLPLRDILHEKFKVPVALGNDANLAALGEWYYGAGRGHRNVLYLTISTGIGGGVICDGHLLLGHIGLAAELGHLTVLPDGPVCGCGLRGHLEAVASGTGIAHYVAEELTKGVPSVLKADPPPSAHDIDQAARHGDALAIQAFARAGTFLGQAIADYLHVFNPSTIILGGGVSHSGSFLIDPMKASMEKRVISPAYTRDLVITTAALGDDAGLLGALALSRGL